MASVYALRPVASPEALDAPDSVSATSPPPGSCPRTRPREPTYPLRGVSLGSQAPAGVAGNR